MVYRHRTSMTVQFAKSREFLLDPWRARKLENSLKHLSTVHSSLNNVACLLLLFDTSTQMENYLAIVEISLWSEHYAFSHSRSRRWQRLGHGGRWTSCESKNHEILFSNTSHNAPHEPALPIPNEFLGTCSQAHRTMGYTVFPSIPLTLTNQWEFKVMEGILWALWWSNTPCLYLEFSNLKNLFHGIWNLVHWHAKWENYIYQFSDLLGTQRWKHKHWQKVQIVPLNGEAWVSPVMYCHVMTELFKGGDKSSPFGLIGRCQLDCTLAPRC